MIDWLKIIGIAPMSQVVQTTNGKLFYLVLGLVEDFMRRAQSTQYILTRIPKGDAPF